MADKHIVTALYGNEICEFLRYYTVAITFLGEDLSFDKAGVGSGVLVALSDRFFILTAGHCAKDYKTGKTAIGITKDQPHRFTPEVARIGFRLNEQQGIDFGYVEIPASYKGTIASQAKHFMGPNRILVESAEQIKSDKDRMVVAGFPGDMTKKSFETEHGSHGTQFFYNSTIIAGTGTAPQSTLAPSIAGIQSIDLSIAPDDQLNTTSGDFQKIDIPRFAGMSGGGCWRSCFVSAETWKPTHMRLVGIHIGSDKVTRRFAREILVGHHLRLIAEDYSDMQDAIYRTWPSLEEAHWATGI